MQQFRIWQVSDTHLSETHAYFQDNWEMFLALVDEQRPDLVVHSGDLTFNAPDAPDDLRFGRAQLDRLSVPWVVIPGNHDVGEPGIPRLDQPVDGPRLAAWRGQFGDDCFARELGHWLLLGLNCEVLGSGLAEEQGQWDFLTRSLAARAGRPVGLFLHKPLFVHTTDEVRKSTGMSVMPAARDRLLELLEPHDIRFIGSGHVHAFAERSVGNTRCAWCPTTAFIDPIRPHPDECLRRAGFLEWTLSGPEFSYELVQPPLFANMDITNWTHTSGTSIDLPPRPLRRFS